ncbi:hypothetical protein J2T13_004599 [Paenibacillus sp. DS2015]|uniref:DUF3829 domain-containing protein n=1 Tax=Paenibacillus sp. DS2015 TaxID=3373917 RepID=UPI003D227048
MEKFNAYVDLGNYITGWLDMDVYSYTEDFGWEEEMTFKNNFDIQKFDSRVLSPIIEGAFDIVDTILEYTSKDPSFGAADETMKELAPRCKFTGYSEIYRLCEVRSIRG